MENFNTHSFSVSLATQIGLEKTIILQHFFYWHCINRENDAMLKNGRTWCFSSRKSIMSYFPYFSDRNIRTIIEKLIGEGFLEKGDFNSDKFKKTNWYALTDKALSLFEGETTNRLAQTTNDVSKAPIDNNNIIIKNNIGERLEKFRKECHEYDGEFDSFMIDKFINYWSEPNRSKTKMRWELQTTWELHRRLLNWASKDFNRGGGTISMPKPDEGEKKRVKTVDEIMREHYGKDAEIF